MEKRGFKEGGVNKKAGAFSATGLGSDDQLRPGNSSGLMMPFSCGYGIFSSMWPMA